MTSLSRIAKLKKSRQTSFSTISGLSQELLASSGNGKYSAGWWILFIYFLLLLILQ